MVKNIEHIKEKISSDVLLKAKKKRDDILKSIDKKKNVGQRKYKKER